MRNPRNRLGVRRTVGAMLAATVVVMALPGAVSAQEIGEPPPDDAVDVRLLDQRLPRAEMPDGGELITARSFLWSEGRRFYQWKNVQDVGFSEQLQEGRRERQVAQLVAHDLDTFEEVAVSDPDLDVMRPPMADSIINPNLAAVDPERGLVYVPRVHRPVVAGSVEGVGVELNPCAVQNAGGGFPFFQRCFTGLYVLDGATLELVATLRFDAIGLDLEAGVIPVAVALAFSPPLGPHSTAKIHVVISEQAVIDSEWPTPRSRTGVQWVAQFNADTDSQSFGRVEWVSRAEACQGQSTIGSGPWNGPFSGLFRSRDVSRPAIWLACPGPGNAVTFVTALDLDPANLDGPPVAQRRWAGPAQSAGIEVDPAGERLLVAQAASSGPTPATWWVFDGQMEAFVGRIDLGYTGRIRATAGLDPTTGRLYLFTGSQAHPIAARRLDGGLGYVDLRQPVLAQPLWLPRFANLSPQPEASTLAAEQVIPIVVDPAAGDRPTRVFVRPGQRHTSTQQDRCDPPRQWQAPCHYYVFEDRVPVAGADVSEPSAETAEAFDDVRTDNVPERAGATTATFDGDVRGYGFRAIQVGGIAATANQPGDTRYLAEHFGFDIGLGYTNPCLPIDRELALGIVGSPERGERARIDARGNAVATARPFHADPSTRADLEAPISRCGGDRIALLSGAGGEGFTLLEIPTWEGLGDLLPVRGFDPDSEPGLHLLYEQHEEADNPFWHVSCVTSDDPEDTSDEQQDPVLPGMAAEVECEHGALRGASQASAAALGPVRVADAHATARVGRRPEGGIVAEVESSTSGVFIAGDQGVVMIDAVQAKATAWASGRSQLDEPIADLDSDGDEGSGEDEDVPVGCDLTATAGACYERSITGATVVDAAGEIVFSCDVCSSPQAQSGLVQAMQGALGTSWIVALRNPDPRLAAGSPDGTQAGISKLLPELEADQMLKGDLLPTLPALELVRVSDSAQGPGRQVFQFAGIETALTYGVQCLLTVIDGECTSEPASLDIELTDPFGTPLPGGVFEVHEAGEDGVLGLEDLDVDVREPLVCVTGPDGNCGFDTMQAGAYVVHQAVAPDGYIPMEDQTIDLPAGGQGTLTVVNGALPVTGIAITLTDLDGEALEGGEFEVHAGETVADDAPPLASCATDDIGVCRFPAPALDDVEVPLPLDLLPVALPDAPEGLLQVPAGAYTVRQASAPEGYEPVDDIPFDLPEGQIARVTLSNAPPWVDGGAADFAVDEGFTEAAAAEPVAFTSSPPVAEPAFHVEFPDQPDQPMAAPGETDDSVARPIYMLPGDMARFALRHPKEALAFGGVLLLFAAAAAGAYRRRLVLDLLGP